MDKKISALLNEWSRRNIAGVYCATKELAVEKVLASIPKSATVGLSGSMTLTQLGIIPLLEARGNEVFNQYRPGLSAGESMEMRKAGMAAEYYLASANALARTGELVFRSAYGHRIGGIVSAKNVVLVCGVNKLTDSLDAAILRSRQVVAPLNSKRLNWNTPCLKDGVCHEEICFGPEYKRMCCELLTIEAEVVSGRMTVVLVGEQLGL